MLFEKLILRSVAVLVLAGIMAGCSAIQPLLQAVGVNRAASIVQSQLDARQRAKERERLQEEREERQARMAEAREEATEAGRYQREEMEMERNRRMETMAEAERNQRERARRFNEAAEEWHRRANKEYEARRLAKIEAERKSMVASIWEGFMCDYASIPDEMREAIDHWSASRYSEGDKSFDIAKGKLKGEPRAEEIASRVLELREWYKIVNKIEKGR